MMFRIDVYNPISKDKKVKVGSHWYPTYKEALAAKMAVNSFKKAKRVGQFRENGPIVAKVVGGLAASDPVKDDRF